MINKKVFSLLLSLIILLVPFTALGAEYGVEFPTYSKYSGGSFIEVESSLGRGVLVFQDSYKAGYIGFAGNSYNLCNLSNSTIIGRFVLQNGTEYTFRFSAYSSPQYQYTNGYINEYRDIGVTQIYNTNVTLIDNTSLDRGNNIDIFNGDSFQYTVVGSLFIFIILVLIDMFRKGN